MMEKSKWMLNSRDQAIHEESHNSKCQSLLNHKDEVTWISKVGIDHMV
jgi:hypothetical protein